MEKSPRNQSTYKWFQDGLLSFIEGFALIAKTPGISRYVVIPIAIQTLVVGGLLFVVYLLSSALINLVTDAVVYLASWFEGVFPIDSEQMANNLETGLTWSIWIIVILLLIYLFMIVWRITGGIITGYYGGKICDAALKHHGWFDSQRETTMVGEVINGVVHAGLIATIQPVLGALPLIPIAGPILAIVVGGGYAAFITGYGELRDPLEKMGMGRFRALQLSIKYIPATIGLGCSKVFSEPIPFLGGLIQATESLGRIRLARRILEAEGELKDTPAKIEAKPPIKPDDDAPVELV